MKLTAFQNGIIDITGKTQSHTRNGSAVAANSYAHAYAYVGGTHRVSGIGTVAYAHDANGNRTQEQQGASLRRYHWDEADRLRVAEVQDSGAMHHYVYGAGGERVLKARSAVQALYVNGTPVPNQSAVFSSYTIYASPLFTLRPDGLYVKHYFAGAQRAASTWAAAPSSRMPMATLTSFS